jgi:iron uptake system component EfeO
LKGFFMSLRSTPDGRLPLTGLLLSLALLLSAAFLAACGSDDDTDSSAQKIAVEITDDGCQPTDLKATSGPATFTVSNPSSDVNNEFEVLDGALILGERENLVAGLSGDVSVNLDPGSYDIVCGNPGNREPTGKLVVSGEKVAATTNPGLSEAADKYAAYVVKQADEMTTRTTAFVAAVKAGDVARAKQLYETSRVPYEKIEPVAESFGNLDPAIDARENDVAQGDPWTGFHPLEKALWVTGLTAADDQLADQLLANVKRLQAKVKNNTYDPVQLANGAVELLNEVSQSKITGEEERYSHVDLTTFKANVDGAKEAFDLLKPELEKTDPELAKEVEGRFDDLYAALDKYKVKGEVYENYSKINQQQRRELSQKVDALAQPLAQIGGQIVTQ